jgi:hypothetical protein
MAFSTDANLVDLIPDILSLGITQFTDEHPKAQSDIERELRIKWWPKKGIAGEMDNTKLTDAQFTRCASYLVLWSYALPQLTNWVNDDRFMHMITFYRARYGEELDAILKDGVEYDTDGDSTVQDDEKIATDASRLDR